MRRALQGDPVQFNSILDVTVPHKMLGMILRELMTWHLLVRFRWYVASEANLSMKFLHDTYMAGVSQSREYRIHSSRASKTVLVTLKIVVNANSR